MEKKAVDRKTKVVDPFTDGWNMGLEPAHDLSMSSWAFNSSQIDSQPFETQNSIAQEDSNFGGKNNNGEEKTKELSDEFQVGLVS